MAAPAGTHPQARDTRLADTMVRLTHVVRRAFADASRAHGLTPVQAELLCVLTTGRTTMTELSHLLDIEKPPGRVAFGWPRRWRPRGGREGCTTGCRTRRCTAARRRRSIQNLPPSRSAGRWGPARRSTAAST